MDSIIVVSGLPRSGTSLMMKMLEAGGLPLLVDHIRQADEDNPKGYFEFEPVKLLKEGEVDWLPQAKGKVIKVVAPLLRYLPADFEYQIIFMRRAMPEILASQRQMLKRRDKDPDAVPDEMIAKAFKAQLAEVGHWMELNQNISFLDIDYASLVQAPRPMLEKLCGFIELDLDLEAMASVVVPSLYRQRGNQS